jgi:DNA-binding transcriptional ArsR family regulator
MRQPPHPDREQLSLVAVLHGLSDPARLEIVRLLADTPERPCTDFHGLGGLTVPTLSHHLRVLREAGLTRTRIDGRRRYLSLRREDLDCRFPGVIDPIIKSADSGAGNPQLPVSSSESLSERLAACPPGIGTDNDVIARPSSRRKRPVSRRPRAWPACPRTCG